jgi:competence protein ComEA
MSLRERLDALSRGELAGLIVVVVLTLGGIGFWYSRSLPKPVAVAATPAPAVAASVSASTEPAVAVASGSSGVAPSVIIVDVTGRVRRPGVYRFQPGDRVIDAIRRAGGPREGADLTALNLAAPLTDGTQILVPKEGEAVAASGSSAGSATGSGSAIGPININTATEPELETLSGVGPVTAAAIIQYRTDHGPFASVDDLLDVSGIGPVTLEELRPQVTV